MKKALLVIIAVLVLAGVFAEGEYEYIEYGNAHMVYDSSTVPTEVAQKLHQFWMSKGGYDNKSGDALLLEKTESGSWIVKAPVFTGAETNPKIVGSFKLLGANMKVQVFNNDSLEFHIADSSFNTLKILQI